MVLDIFSIFSNGFSLVMLIIQHRRQQEIHLNQRIYDYLFQTIYKFNRTYCETADLTFIKNATKTICKNLQKQYGRRNKSVYKIDCANVIHNTLFIFAICIKFGQEPTKFETGFVASLKRLPPNYFDSIVMNATKISNEIWPWIVQYRASFGNAIEIRRSDSIHESK